MPNASLSQLRAKQDKVAAPIQRQENWLLRRVISDLASQDEFRLSIIIAEYNRRMVGVRAA